MAFVQVIQFRTSRQDEIRALVEDFRSRATGTGPRRVLACRDRDGQGRYATIAEFGSYEEAMANSSAPETQEFAARMAELCDGPPTFLNLDVVESFDG